MLEVKTIVMEIQSSSMDSSEARKYDFTITLHISILGK
jgi:hypothetical protein